MTELGAYLKQIREQKDRSKLWAERRSKELYPDDRERQISHTYLKQIEEGLQGRPNPMKLKTLAEIYRIDYRRLMSAAGFIEAEGFAADMEEAEIGDKELFETASMMFDRLREQSIHPEYFMNAVIGLPEESLSIVHRLITTLSIQGKTRRKKEIQKGLK